MTPHHHTIDVLHELGLTGMAAAYEEQLASPDIYDLSFDERLGLLVDREAVEREGRRLASRLRSAHLRESATIEDVDFHHPRGLDKAALLTLAQGQWVEERHNILITGPTGTGKSYLACAFAHKAIRQGHTALYVRLPRLLEDLAFAHGDGRYLKLLTQLAKVTILVIDDFGLVHLSETQSHDILEVLEDRYMRKSTIITSQLPTSLLVIATYLYHYQPIASTVGVASRLVDAASVTVSTNGALLLPNALFQSRDANLIAGSIWIAVQVIILRNVISLNKSQRRIYAFPFGLILVSLMFSVMVGIGRSTSILVPSRYSSFTLLGLVGVFVYLSHGLSRWKWSAGGKKATDFLLAVSLSVLITWTVLIGDIAGLSQGKVIHSQRVEGALALKQFLLHPNSSSNLGVEKYVYPRDSDWVRHQAMLFQSKHLEIDYLMVPRHP